MTYETLLSRPLPTSCTNITLITDKNLAVEVPAPGMGVAIAAQYPTGVQGQSGGFMVFNNPETEQIVARAATSAPIHRSGTGSSISGTDDACSDTANTPYLYKLIAREPWYFNPSGVPANMGSVVAKNAVEDGFGFVASGFNDCGLSYNFSSVLRPSYVAGTYVGTGVGNGVCASPPDLYSVVSFDLSAGTYLAATCTHVNASQQTVTADVQFNTRYDWTNTLVGCTNAFEVQGTAAHEWGHAAGLNHVLEATSPWLTMSENSNGECEGSQRTLGAGDLIGLDAKY